MVKRRRSWNRLEDCRFGRAPADEKKVIKFYISTRNVPMSLWNLIDKQYCLWFQMTNSTYLCCDYIEPMSPLGFLRLASNWCNLWCTRWSLCAESEASSSEFSRSGRGVRVSNFRPKRELCWRIGHWKRFALNTLYSAQTMFFFSIVLLLSTVDAGFELIC